MNNLTLLKKIWAELYAPDSDVQALVEQYFHPDCEQCINGVVLKRDKYTEHVMAQKKNMIIESIDYQHSIEQGDELFSLYFPKGKDMKGNPILAEVISYFKFRQGQIVYIHGQVRMIEGKPSDADM